MNEQFLVFFPSIFNWIVVLISEASLSQCPIHFFCLFLIVGPIYQGSFISNQCQQTYFLICDFFSPTDFLQSSPNSNFEGLRSFYIFLSHIQSMPDPYSMQDITQQCFYHSLIKILASDSPVSTGIFPHSLPEWAFRARPGLWRICRCPKVARIAEHKLFP